MSERRYFWLKLPTGFFKRHDIKILEAMDNGKDYLLFYMKLMLESLDHEGQLRFSDAIPYDYKMLSIVTDTNVDIVKTAMEVLEKLQLIKIMDDETIYIQAVERMIGSETAAAERQRRSRENRRALEGESVTMSQAVTACHSPSQICHREIEIDKEKEIEIDKEKDIYKTSEKSDELDLAFDKIYYKYPKKVGKSRAKQIYKALLTKGRKIDGKTVKFTHEDICAGLNVYYNDKTEPNNGEIGDTKYWMNFDTLMNRIQDYVERREELDE